MTDHPTPTFQIRVATPADADQIAKLFFDTVHHVNSRDYAPHQIPAWAPTVRPAADWADRQNSRRTWVAVIGESVLGFGELEASGHIDCFYCHRDHQGVGVGTALMAAIVAAAVRLGVPKLFAGGGKGEASNYRSPCSSSLFFVVVVLGGGKGEASNYRSPCSSSLL